MPNPLDNRLLHIIKPFANFRVLSSNSRNGMPCFNMITPNSLLPHFDLSLKIIFLYVMKHCFYANLSTSVIFSKLFVTKVFCYLKRTKTTTTTIVGLCTMLLLLLLLLLGRGRAAHNIAYKMVKEMNIDLIFVSKPNRNNIKHPGQLVEKTETWQCIFGIKKILKLTQCIQMKVSW